MEPESVGEFTTPKTHKMDIDELQRAVSFLTEVHRKGIFSEELEPTFKRLAKVVTALQAQRESYILGVKHETQKNRRLQKQMIALKCGINKGRRDKAIHWQNAFGDKLSPLIVTRYESLATVKTTNYALPNSRICHICRQKYSARHHFYERLCSVCGEENYGKRKPAADLTGKIAIVTGARIKIGYETALILLRNGATVIATTRFAGDAEKRFSSEIDFDKWKSRLDIYPVDFRFLSQVFNFCSSVAKRYERVDFLINNAAQTVRKPPAFYQHLLRESKTITTSEQFGIEKLDGANGFSSNPLVLSQVQLLPSDHVMSEQTFPSNEYDSDRQQVDHRVGSVHSWMMKLEDVPTIEFMEDICINTVTPMVLVQQLTPLLRRTNPKEYGFVINVSAVEGQFSAFNKSARHPHTNMCKAALNMMTRTSAGDYFQRHQILMNSVDTGWVTDEKANGFKEVFDPPLDNLDGAVRVLDPIFEFITHEIVKYGRLFKNFKTVDW